MRLPNNASLIAINNIGFKEVLATLPTDPKILYVDEECKQMLSTVVSFSEILDVGFYAVELMSRLLFNNSSATHYRSRFLACVVMCRPTRENVALLTQLLRDPKYKEYVLIFSNAADQSAIEKLARCDTRHSAVAKVLEVYCDFFALRPRLFSLELPSVSRVMSVDKTCWQPYDDQIFQRCSAGLAALTASLIKDLRRTNPGTAIDFPVFRFSANSSICSMLALDTLTQLRKLWPHITRTPANSAQSDAHASCLVLVLDRREDLYSPLLNPWTYQAMLHEQIGIRLNRIKLGEVESNIDPRDDTFMMANMEKTFGEVTATIASEVKTVGSTPTAANDLTELITDYSERKRHVDMVMRHADLIHKLTANVTNNKLFDISRLEQRIVCSNQQLGIPFSSAQSEMSVDLEKLLKDPQTPEFEKFRLVALRVLKSLSTGDWHQLAQRLVSLARLGSEQLQLLEALCQFVLHWQPIAAPEWTLMTAAKQALNRSISQPAGLMQYRSRVSEIAENGARGSLDRKAFPQVQQETRDAAGARGGDAKPRLTIVFVVGGVTLEEGRELAESDGVYLGGSCVLNSKTLLADLAQIAAER